MTSIDSPKNHYSMAIVGLILTTFFWAGNALVARYIADAIPPFALSFWRWTIPALMLLPFTLKTVSRYRSEIAKNRARLLLLALLSIASYNTILYMAAQTTTAINITLVSTSLPFGTLLFTMLIFKTLPAKIKLLGAFISLGGVLTILSKGTWSHLTGVNFNQGDLLMIAAVLCWSLYSVLIKHWHINIPAFPLLCILITFGAPLIAPFYLVEWYEQGGFELDQKNLTVLAYVGVFPSVLAYLFWNYGVRVVGPATASIFSYLIPIFTTLLSITLLGELPAYYHLAGGVLTLGGLVLATFEEKAQIPGKPVQESTP